MNTENRVTVKPKVKKEAKKDLVSQFIGVLSALIPILFILGINIEWLNAEFIDSLEVFLIALVAFIANLVTIWKNHYTNKKAQKQNQVLKDRGLK